MDLRERDILNDSVDNEEDVESGEHVDGRFETINDETEATSSEESEDPEFRELEERSQIVEKYERGPEQEVEEWENPDLELYKITDRYGFMHKDMQEIGAQELAEKKRMAKEVSREQKWLRMISRWNDRKGANEKLKKRLWKGVPEKFRSLVWTRLLGINRYRKEQNSNVYRELLMRARLISKDIKQIDLDINRTYRDHLAFRRRYDVKQQSLFNVLAAYAMYNTEVGYCQGMSQIAALFLMYMDEEDSFWCLHALLVDKKHSMHGFFVPGFPKLVRFQTHYEKILQKYLPRLKKHLDKAGIPPIYVTKWWFGCFLDRVPFPLALRLWDVFLLEGDVILIAMAYNIMKMHEKTMRKLQMENFMEYIQTVIAQDFGFSDEEAMKSLQDCLRKLHSDRMLLPSSPKPGDAPETPIKPFGPVLSRSMIDIRLDIAEIQSRCSRANSIAGRSPVGIRRPRLPPSPTPLSKYKLSQLPPRHMESTLPENSQSSFSSTSTVKDTSLREQQQLPKIFTDTTNNTNLSICQPESRENLSQVIQQQSSPMLAKQIEVKVVRPLAVEKVQHNIRMNDGNSSPFYVSPSSHANSREEFGSRRQQLHPQQQQQRQLNKRPTTLATGQQIRQPDFQSNSTPKTAEYFGAIDKHKLYQFPPEEPPVDYNDTSFSVQPRCSTDSTYPITSTANSPTRVTSSFFCSPDNLIPLKRNEVVPGDYASGLFESDYSRSKFRSQSDDDGEMSHRLLRRTQRGSFYDNVPSFTPNASSSNEFSQIKSTNDQRRINGDLRAHPASSSLDRQYKYSANNPVLQESNRECRITETETRVVQLPNNVTCVKVGDTINSISSPLQQRQYYNVPVRKEIYNTRVAADTDDYVNRDRSNTDLQPHRHHYSSNTTSRYSRYEQPHFPVKSNQLESPVHYERNTANDRQLERHPSRFRPDQYQYYNDKD
ncbi:USP6 N-terminal-like protein [Dirofilaria immitis]